MYIHLYIHIKHSLVKPFLQTIQNILTCMSLKVFFFFLLDFFLCMFFFSSIHWFFHFFSSFIDTLCCSLYNTRGVCLANSWVKCKEKDKCSLLFLVWVFLHLSFKILLLATFFSRFFLLLYVLSRVV